jgi:hypothetical protein
MVSNEKILKQKNSLRSGIHISICLALAGLAMVLGLIYGFGWTFPAAVAVYLGYRVLRLVLRLIGQILSIVFTVISIIILIIIISLIII